MKYIIIVLITCFFFTATFAADAVVKEETTPPPSEAALTVDQLKPIITMNQKPAQQQINPQPSVQSQSN